MNATTQITTNAEFDQIVKGNVNIKKLSKFRYRITFSKIGKFLVYQVWYKDNANKINDKRLVRYMSAKLWISSFKEINDSLKNNGKLLFTPTTIMETDDYNKYAFVIHKIYLNSHGEVVFAVSTKQISLKNNTSKKIIQLPCGKFNNVRFDIDNDMGNYPQSFFYVLNNFLKNLNIEGYYDGPYNLQLIYRPMLIDPAVSSDWFYVTTDDIDYNKERIAHQFGRSYISFPCSSPMGLNNSEMCYTMCQNQESNCNLNNFYIITTRIPWLCYTFPTDLSCKTTPPPKTIFVPVYNKNNPFGTAYEARYFERDTGMPFKEEYKKMFPGAYFAVQEGV
jgi:hypothetical protein